GKVAEAAAILEAARPHHEAALEANPQNPIYRGFYGNNLRILSNCYRNLGDHAHLATTAEDIARFGPDPANNSYDAVGFLCDCMLLVDEDTQLDQSKRKELAQNYGDRAMTQLRQAIARGWKGGADTLKRDSYLNPLRTRDDFQKLLTELEASSGNK